MKRKNIPEGYAKRSKPFTKKPAQKTLQQQVKVALLRELETKRYIVGTSKTIGSGNQYWNNIMYWQTQGTGYQQRVGTNIHLQSIDLSYFFIRDLTASYNGTRIYCAIVHTDQEAHDGTVSPALALNLLPDSRAAGSGDVSNPIWDKNVYTLVYETAIYVTGANLTTANEFGTRKVNVPINRKLTFKGDSAGYTKQNNYYVYFGVTDGSATANIGALYYTAAVNFKDA